MIRSLAVPVSLVRDYGNHTPRGRELIVSEFRDAVKFLLSLDSTVDQDLDYIKSQVSDWFQEGVGDIRTDTGHTFPVPNSMVTDALQRRKTLFSGYLLRLIRRLILRSRHGNGKAISILASFLLLKRGWPELSLHKKLESVKDHQKYLGTSVPSISLDLEDCIRRVVKTVIGDMRNSFVKFSPSHNASFNSSRKKGGAYGEVVETDYRAPERRPVPRLGGGDGSGARRERPSLYAITRSVGNWKSSQHDHVVEETRKILKFHRPAPELGARNRRPTLLSVRVQVIPEPGKFRIITAGNGFLYTHLQGLQGALLDAWKRQRCSTMKEGWEREVEKWVAPEGWVWNSGDYKAATDQLNVSSSRTALEEVLRVVGLDGMETGLCDSIIEYPSSVLSEGMSRSVFQRNGQLMGHPLSFPILCMINLAGLKRAVEIGLEEKVLTKADAHFILSHCKINGDDILFACPPTFVHIWEKTAADLGLKLSIGKSYSSSHFAMVNNVMFLMGRHGGRQLGYANQKLIFNFSLKTGSDKELTPLEIGDAFNNMFEHFPLSRSFLSDAIANRRLESNFGYEPNFFVSPRLGGLGIDPQFASGKIRLTRIQRQVAALFAEDVLSSFLFSNGFNTGGELMKLLRELPAPRLSTAANAEVYEIRWRPLRTKSGVVMESHWDSDDRSYAKWVALFTSVTASLAEAKGRRVNPRKLVNVNPMKREKVLFMEPVWLFPELPEPKTGFTYSYSL